MKKMKFGMCIMIMSALLSVGFASCGDDGDDDDWSGNTDDVAVTGPATDITFCSATVKGAINLDNALASAAGSTSVEIEWTDEEYYIKNNSFDEREVIKEIKGNRIETKITNISPDTKYVYRTLVTVEGQKYYGQLRSFTTGKLSDMIKSLDIVETGQNYACFIVKMDDDPNLGFDVGIYYSYDESRLQDEYLNEHHMYTAQHDSHYDYDKKLEYYNEYNQETGELVRIYLSKNERRYVIYELSPGIKYYYRSFTRCNNVEVRNDIKSFEI